MTKGTRKLKPNPKWNFAIGTTSRVPDRSSYHYLIMDIDQRTCQLDKTIKYLHNLRASLIIIQPTSSGWHIYTNIQCTWRQLFHLMPPVVDQKWLQMGKKRGYLYLADKSAVTFPWPVERMVLHYNGQKKKHSS